MIEKSISNDTNKQYFSDSQKDRIIFHIDVNSAFLSWTAVDLLNQGETLDLRTIPSIIGGDSEKRHGIVLAKSIPAKKYGISTAEPIVNAFRKCPNLINKSPNFEVYRRFSNGLMNHLRSYCPDIEQVSIDECYMDFTPIMHLYNSPVEAAHQIKDSVRDLFGFTVNVGISDRKVLAKMASDFEKPDKVHTLFHDEIAKKMWPLPVSELYMCGKSATKLLYNLGIRTIGELANANPQVLSDNLKSHGMLLYEFANGIDSSTVNTFHEKAKGIGNSTTLSHDVTSADEAKKILLELSDSVASRTRKDNRLAGMVTVEIKYSDFKTNSHQAPLKRLTSSQMDIYNEACDLFDKLWNGNPIRLLGIRVGKLEDVDAPIQMNIFDYMESDSIQKKKELDSAIDSIRNKYGTSAIIKGSQIKK